MRDVKTRINMRSWRNWQTRTVQVRVGNHGGSNPFDRTKKMSTPLGVLIFLVPIGGFEPDANSKATHSPAAYQLHSPHRLYPRLFYKERDTTSR